MKIVIAPDSFKGTLSATRAAERIAEGLRGTYPDAELVLSPIADGGEGTMDCLKEVLGGEILRSKVHGPFLEPVNARFLLTPAGMAVVETAEAIGLPLAGERKNPLLTSTYGAGELIRAAMDAGAKEVLLTLGGSSTNDGGIGMACALGLKACNSEGKEFLPTGGTLSDIRALDFMTLDARIKSTSFTALCDVTTKLTGATGASYIFAPQKGAGPQDLPLLDKGLFDLAQRIKEATGKDYLDLEGGGAAGGLGMGTAAFLNAELKKGIDTVLDLIGFQAKIQDADAVITGEGRVDNQSFMGKVLSGVASRVKASPAKLYIIAGSSTADKDTLTKYGVQKLYVTSEPGRSWEDIRLHAEEDLLHTAQLFRI